MHAEWRKILRHAWSVRFIALAVILSGLEAALPLYQQFANIDPLWFIAGIGVCSSAAFASRLVAQKELSGVPHA